jgi:hypothetical protein
VQNKPADFQPQSKAELLEGGEQAWQQIERKESELVPFLQQMWDLSESTDSDLEERLARLRPEPGLWGQEFMVPAVRGTGWDLTADPPVPLDFGVPVHTHLQLSSWFERFEHCDDQQLVSHLRQGVTSQSQLDGVTLLAPPLLSLVRGLKSISKELKRLVEQGYLKKYSQQPTWPSFTSPIGARAKGLTDVFRRITDRGFPWGTLITEDLLRVLPPNLRVRAALHLPKEIKPCFEDLAREICILRYIGDILGWTLVQLADDLKDWFYQLYTLVRTLAQWFHLPRGWEHTTGLLPGDMHGNGTRAHVKHSAAL